MKIQILIVYIIVTFLASAISTEAKTPKNKDLGFGLILGEPAGASVIFKIDAEESIHAYIGNSYFGDIKIGADYLWYFDAFNSKIVTLYTGPGAFIGFGEGNKLFRKKENWDNDAMGIGIRGVLGVNFIPKNTSIEIFLESAIDLTIVPDNLTQPYIAIGFRFYP